MDSNSCHRLLVGLSACVAIVACASRRPPGRDADDARGAAVVQTGAAPEAAAKIDPAARREDWRWLDRYPDESSHRRAEAAELQVVIDRLRQPNERLAQLIDERKPLEIEAAFPQGQAAVSSGLRGYVRKLEKSDASFAALRDVFRLLEQDVDFIVAKYGNERGHLRKLWAGAAPGSIGFLKPLSAPSR